jgi:hypothetical protein
VIAPEESSLPSIDSIRWGKAFDLRGILCNAAKSASRKHEVAPESKSAEVLREQWERATVIGSSRVGMLSGDVTVECRACFALKPREVLCCFTGFDRFPVLRNCQKMLSQTVEWQRLWSLCSSLLGRRLQGVRDFHNRDTVYF